MQFRQRPGHGGHGSSTVHGLPGSDLSRAGPGLRLGWRVLDLVWRPLVLGSWSLGVSAPPWCLLVRRTLGTARRLPHLGRRLLAVASQSGPSQTEELFSPLSLDSPSCLPRKLIVTHIYASCCHSERSEESIFLLQVRTQPKTTEILRKLRMTIDLYVTRSPEVTVEFKSARKKIGFGIGTKGHGMSEGTCYEKIQSLQNP